MLKKIFTILFILFFLSFKINAQMVNEPSPRNVFQQQNQQINQDETSPRYAVCDLCGYCPPNPPPKNWLKCKKCLYPNVSDDPSLMETLKIDPQTNLPPTPMLGRQYTFLGCLGGGSSFSEENAGGLFVQSILNIIFSTVGGIAFLYLIYGSFVIITSQSDPERLNYGKRIISGAIIGLIFSLSSVFIINFIASGILKLPGFTK